jgi:hypothetical protein
MLKIIGSCGLNCAECPAFVASLTGDEALKEKTAIQWKEMFGFDAGPQGVNCHGCHTGCGAQIGHCAECEIRACAYGKSLKTCAECADFGSCGKIQGFFSHAPEAKKNLDALRAS